MKKLLIAISIFITACGNDDKHGEQPVPAKDTINTDTVAVTIPVKEEPLDEKDVRNISNFAARIGNAYFDSLNAALFKDTATTFRIKDNICGGDYCYSYQTLQKGDITLHFFKGDAYDYGFDNKQYILKKGEPDFIRYFDIDMSMDSVGVSWEVIEKIYVFGPNKVIARERKAITRNRDKRISLLDTIPFTFSKMNKAGLVRKEMAGLKEDLERETME